MIARPLKCPRQGLLVSDPLHQRQRSFFPGVQFCAALLAVLVGLTLVFAVISWADESIAPLFLNSRIERLGETGLPKLRVERGGIICCRMKADDFRFPLPPGSHATNGNVSGGFDTVDGSVEARLSLASK
jgi:hypothetical protein